MSGNLGVEGCSCENTAFGSLAKKITGFLNTAPVDSEGKWRSHFITEILSIIQKSGICKEDCYTCSTRPKFTITLSGRNNEASSYEGSDTAPLLNPQQCPWVLKTPKKLNSTVCLTECHKDFNSVDDLVSKTNDLARLDDEKIVEQLKLGRIKHRDLEVKLGTDHVRAVRLRRLHLRSTANLFFSNLPFENYDYSLVNGACCENVIGYVPIPTGFAGPLLVNGRKYMIPLATTEGALVASTNRGCKALTDGDGVSSVVIRDGMTRAPVLQCKSVMEALKVKMWLEDPKHFALVRDTFDATTSYGKLVRIDAELHGRLLFVRFEATTGDAMGMNMVSKGVNAVLHVLKKRFADVEVLSLSGNYCVDKKASAINWIKGRGKSVVAEAFLPGSVVRRVLKTDVKTLCDLANAKLLIGSSMAVTVGGWNAHAANIVAAMFLSTGQDVAQVVSSSMCLTTIEETKDGNLHICCSMRCLEVGTVGGGTILPAQKECLRMLGCDGPSESAPGDNAKRLAEIICAAVLAGELSLMAAQCTNDLVRSHMKLNRSMQHLPAQEQCSRSPAIPAIKECNGASAETLPDSSGRGLGLFVRGRVSDKNNDDTKLECSAIL